MALEAPDCEYGGEFKKIEAVDEKTVKMTLCYPDPAFPSKVAFSAFGINDADYLEETGGGGTLIEQPNGTGPYKLAEWRRGDQIIFERNPDYWGEPAIAQNLIFRWSAESASAWSSCRRARWTASTTLGPTTSRSSRAMRTSSCRCARARTSSTWA